MKENSGREGRLFFLAPPQLLAHGALFLEHVVVDNDAERDELLRTPLHTVVVVHRGDFEVELLILERVPIGFETVVDVVTRAVKGRAGIEARRIALVIGHETTAHIKGVVKPQFELLDTGLDLHAVGLDVVAYIGTVVLHGLQPAGTHFELVEP